MVCCMFPVKEIDVKIGLVREVKIFSTIIRLLVCLQGSVFFSVSVLNITCLRV